MKKITEKQYLKAKRLVMDYERFFVKAIPKITIDDLQILYKTIQIPKLKEGVVDDGYACALGQQLGDAGLKLQWVSLDDMGFISITLSDGFVDGKVVDIVLREIATLQ